MRSWVVLRPVFGSVTAKQVLTSPRAIGGSMRCFWASLPNTTTGLSPNTLMCTAEAPDIPAPEREMVCIITAASAIDSPEPPYCSGMQMPSQPSLARLSANAVGKPPSRSRSSQ